MGSVIEILSDEKLDELLDEFTWMLARADLERAGWASTAIDELLGVRT